MMKELFGAPRFLGFLFLLLCVSIPSLAVPPRAHHIYISGATVGTTAGTGIVKTPTAMRNGQTLRVWYTYADNDGQPEAGTTFQWFTYDDNFGTNPQPIAGATGVTFTLTAAQVGKHIAVRVNPRNATDGFGATAEFRPWDPTNSNVVYPTNGSCQLATGAGNPTPGNIILNPSSSLCSPRSLTWQVRYTGINWQTTGGLVPKIIIDWGDGIQETLDPRLFNAGSGTYDVGTYNLLTSRQDTLNLTNVLRQEWRVEQPHTYDYTIGGRTVSATANERCTYTMTTTWGVGGSSCLGFNRQTQKFAVWDKESNTNLGTVDMNKTAGTGGFETGEITDICPTDRTAIRISDASDFNCTPGGIVENPNPNDGARWVQFVYGTTNTLATGPGATEKITIGGQNYDASDLPIYGPVTYLPASVTTPSAQTLNIQVPTTATVGQNMVITMRLWNVCHPFDLNTVDGNGLNPPQVGPFNVFNIYGPPGNTHPTGNLGGPPFFANAAPATRTYTIRVAAAPPAPTVTYTINHCDTDGTGAYLMTSSKANAASTLRWYSDAALTNLQKSSSASNTFNPATEGSPNMNITATSQDKAVTYYVVEQQPGANGCTSPPQTMTFHITDTNTPGAIDHPDKISATVIPICSGDDPDPFTSATAATGGNGTPSYQWQQSNDNFATNTVNIGGATAATYDPPVLTATTWYRRRVSSGFCPDAFTNVMQIRVDVPATAGTIGNPQTVCSGVTDPSALTSVAPGGGGNGTPSYQWLESPDNFVAISNPIAGATGATYDPPVLTTTTYYRRVNTSGVCPANVAVSNIIRILVQPAIVPGTISGTQTICSGQTPTGLTGGASTGGNGTPTYQWESSTTSAVAGFTTIGGATSQNFAPGALTATTWFRRLTSAGVCAPAYSNVVQVSVNPLPGGNVTGGGSICAGSPAPDIVFTFNAGTGPWDLVYSIDGVNQPVVTGTTSPYTITSPTQGVYRIVSIRDANTCLVTAPHANITTTGPATVTVGGQPPAFDTAPALGASAVCSAGGATADPSLTFDLTALSTVTAANYTLNYKVDGSAATFSKTFQVNAGGTISQVNGAGATAMTFNEAAFNNLTPAPHVLRIVSIISPTGCQTILNQDLNFTVNPLPAGTNQTMTAVCSPYTFNFDPQVESVAVGKGGNGVASTFAWTANFNGLTGMTSPGAGNIAGTLTNTTNATVNAVFTVTPTSTATPACPGGTFTITVPVKPVPKISNFTPAICSGNAFAVTPLNNNPVGDIVPVGTTYTWTVAPNANITGASNQGTAQASIGQTLTNISNTQQTILYTVTPLANGCTGATFTVNVTVNPKPVIPNQTVATCSGTAFNVSPANGNPTAAVIVPANTTYTWGNPVVTGGITGGSAQSNQTAINQTLTNPSTSPQTATYTVTPTSGAAGACVGSPFTVTVTVNPIPKLSSSLTPPGICSGTFNSTSTSLTAGATFTWSRANVPGINESGVPPTPGAVINEVLTNPTTAPVDVTYVIVTSANGCSNAPGQNVVVRVNPTPIANPVLGPSNVCVGTNPFFYSVTQRAGSTYSWEIPASFTVEAAGGGATPGGGPGAFSSDYFILLKFGTATPPGGLQIRVRERSADGCIGAPNTLTIVAANSPPTVPISGGNTFCKFEKGVVFSVPQNASSTFTWSVNSGATIIGPAAGTNLYQIIVDFNNSPSAQIDVTETNITGCPANYPSLIVSLLDAPVTTPVSRSICSGEQPSSVVDLNTITTIPSTFNWFVKSITPNVTGTFVNTTGTGQLQHLPPLSNVSGTNGTVVYTVTPTSSSSPFCIGVPVDITITVKPEPVVTAIANQSFCPQVFVNGGVSFPLTSNVAGATINWTSSNPAIGLVATSGSGNISFTAADNTTGVDIVSTITVTATSNGCTSAGANSKTFTITIKPRPVINPITDIIVCPGDNVAVPAFVSNTSGGETYAWTNDNPAIGLAGSGNGNIAGYFAPANNTGSDVIGNISVTATRQSCAGPARTFRIVVKPQPVVQTITDKAFCPGDAISIPLTTNVAGAVINWSNTNTSTGILASGTGNITAVAPANNTGADIVGTITVTATANGCLSTGANTKSFTVTIKPTPILDAVTDIVVCSGANIPATVFTSNIASGSVTFNWTNSNTAINLGGSGIGNIPAFTAAVNTSGTPMVANISVTGTKNSCSGPATLFKITVNPEPVVTAVTDQEFCPGDNVSIALASNVAGATINYTNSNALIGLATTGNGNINFVAPANNTGAVIEGTIVVQATANGCTSTGGNSKTFKIRIKPTPIVNTVADVTVCSGTAISTIPFSANTGGGETFSWTNDNASIGLPVSGNGNIPGYTAPINVGGSAIVANITVSASRNGCAGPSKTFKITVNPEPVVNAVANQAFCPGDGVAVALSSNVAGATINWTNSNTLIGLSGSGAGNISYVAPANTTGSDIVGTITVIATKDGCSSSPVNQKTFTITIKPTPVVNAISNISVCSGGSVTIPAFGSNVASGGVTFDWTNDTPSIGLVASGTGNIATFNATANTTSSPIVATISVIGTKNGCASVSPRTFTITIQPEPVGTSDVITICSDAAVGVNLATMITGGASAARYNITITNTGGLSASAGSPADGTNLPANEIQNDKWTNQSGVAHDIVYNITPLSGGTPACAGAPFTLTVHVNPEPVVNTVANQIFCPGDAVNIPLSSNVAGATMSWTNSNPGVGLGFTGTGNIVYTAPANNTGASITATITVMAESATCVSSGTNIKKFDITIKPTPVINTVSDVVVCSGGSINAINFAANTGGGETFAWVNDNPSIGLVASGGGNIAGFTAPVNVSGVPVVANITVTATKQSCAGPAMVFKIIVNPEPVVAAIANASFCPTESISIPLTSNVAGATINWTNDNTAIGLASSGGGNIVYVAPSNTTGSDIVGTITVFASKDGCTSGIGNLKTFTITIKPSPIVNFVSDITVCSGATIPAINFGSNVSSGGVNFTWTNNNTAIGLVASGNGNIASFTAGSNLTSSPIKGTISVTGTKNGCAGPVRNFDITILPQPVGNPVPVTVCSDAAVAVNLNSLISGTAATYNITITNVASLPASAGAPANVNGAFAAEIQDDRWTNTTGTPQPIVYHITPIGPGSPGCVGNTFDLTVTVNPEPVVAAVTNKEFCATDAVNIPLTSNVSGATISWNNTNPLIGIGSNGTGDIVYVAPANNTGADIVGTITVSASKDGCVSSGTNLKTFDIRIKPTPIINQVANITVCSGKPISTINFAANTGGSETFSWTNSNPAVGLAASGVNNIPGYNAPVNLSGSPIVATITVNALRNGCPGPAMNFTITVNPEPVVNTVANQAFCPGDNISIALGSNVAGANINWTNSNPTIGIGSNGSNDIIYTAPSNNTGSDVVGNITVFASKDGCLSAGANVKTFTITIKPTPLVNAIGDIIVCSGDNIVVPAFGSNVVSGSVTFDWTNDNPAIGLAASGTGDITTFAAATNITGLPVVANISVKGTKNSCSGPAVSFRITVNPEPVVAAISDAEFCPGELVNIPLTSNVAGAAIKWTNSNTAIGILATGNGDIVYTAPTNTTGADFVGTITVTAERNGCTSTGANSKTFQITIKAAPVVNTVTSIQVCSGDAIPTINFASNADPGVVFNWTNDNPAIGLAASGSVNIPGFTSATNTGAVPMIANISVTGTKNGCTGVAMNFQITVLPQPVLANITPADVCSRDNANITLSTNGASVNAALYRLDLIEYSSNGGPFSTTLPAKFTPAGGNKAVGSSGNTSHLNTEKFTNLSPFRVVVRYTITPIGPTSPSNPSGCAGAAATVSVGINPEPDLDDTLNPSNICSGETVVSGNPGFLLRSDPTAVAATSFIIRTINPNGLTGGALNATTGVGKAANAINNDSWTNTSNVIVNVEYTIAPVTNGCVGLDEIVTVRVNPSPAVKDGLDRLICNDAVTGVVLQDNSPTSINADRYDIISVTVGGSAIAPGATVGGLTAAATNATTGITTNVNRIRDDVFHNNTTDRIVVSYTVVGISPVAFNSCRGPQKVITVTIEPSIVSASTILSPLICSDSNIEITFVSPTYANGAPTNPSVTFSYTTLPSAIIGTTVGNNLAEGDKITDHLINTTNAPIDVTYRITPRAAAAAGGVGCNGAFQDIVVRVEPKPKINPLANKTVCENTSINLNLVSPSTPTTGTIKIFVTATADPEIGGYTNNSLIDNNTVLGDLLTNSASTTKFVTYHLEVRNVDAANTTICSAAPIDVIVGVTPTPVFTPPIADFAICSGESFAPIPINTDTNGAIPGSTTITWTVDLTPSVSGESNGAGENFSQVLFNTTSDKQVVTYHLKATNISNVPACAAPVQDLRVTVYPNPKINNLPTQAEVCNNGTFKTPLSAPYVIQASTVPALGTTFDWTVDNGSNPDLPVIAPAFNQTQIAQTFVNNGSFLGTQTYSIIAHLTIPAADNPIIDAGMGIDATCTATQEGVMVVNVAPQVGADLYGFDIDGNQATDLYLCRGSKQFLYFDPTGLPLMEIEYSVNGVPQTPLKKLGGLSVQNVSPANTTTYELTKVTDKFGCSVTPNKVVTVNVDEVDNTFTVGPPAINCSPFTAEFKHNQVAGTSYTWKWLDGPDSTTYLATTSVPNMVRKHTYYNLSPAATQTYRASLDAYLDETKYLAGCRKRPVVVEVKVYPTVAPAVFIDRNEVCSGDLINLTNQTQGSTNNKWFVREAGNIGQELDIKTNFNVTYNIVNNTTTNPKDYEIVYRSSNANCPAPDQVLPIKVYRGVTAHFTNNTPTDYVGGVSNVTFTNDSNPIDATDFRYDWNFGADASPATAATPGPTFPVSYANPGLKEIKLVVTNIKTPVGLTCASEFNGTINIVPPPLVVDFVAIPLKACFPSQIEITDNLGTGNVSEWRLLDAGGTVATSNLALPTFKVAAPGKYTIELTTKNTFTNEQKTITKDVIIYDLPMASFDLRPNVVFVPDTEMLTYNYSEGATSYLWDFGDGETKTEKEPKHIYRLENVYDVTLIAMNDHGDGVVCSDTLVRKVTAKQGGVTRVPNAFTPSPFGPSTTIGNQPDKDALNDVFLPQVRGAVEFNMQIFDRWGNLIFESDRSDLGWDGYDRNGKFMPAGVYVYKLTLRLSDGQRTTQIGDITMIR